MRTNTSFKKKALTAAVSAATVLLANSAMAEELLEEVTVTATARAQSVQEIPFNISAISGSDIASQNIVTNADLMRSIAGVSLIDRGHRNSGTANSLVIRGINVDSGISGADVGSSVAATVSTYVDSTPIFANFLLKDIERVEVLRGPQGTLYGSGALGGTVRYIMNKPNTEQFEGNVKVGYGQTNGSDGNNTSTDAMINLPLTDTVAFRASAGTLDNAGVVDYVNMYQTDGNGVPVVEADNGDCLSVSDSALTSAEIQNNGSCYKSDKDADDVDIWYARAALSFEPSDELSFLLSYQVQEDEIGGRRAVTTGLDYFGSAYGDDDNGSTLSEESERESELVSLSIEADLGFATLTSNTSVYETEGSGWRDNTSLWVTDRSAFGSYSNWFDSWYTGNPRPAAHVEAGFEEEALVQEIRLVSNTEEGDKIDWVVGLYYMDQDRETYNYSHLLGLEEYGLESGGWWAGWGVHDMDMTYVRKENFKDKAAYGELTYHVSDDFRVTAGARWFDNKLTNSTALDAYYGQAAVIPFVDYPDQEEDDILMKLNLSWDLSDDTMVYATYSEGFRRGGSNAIPINGSFAESFAETVETFGKDSVSNYELGIKGELDWVRYSANLYYVDWQDPQLNTATAGWAFFMAQNGDSAATQGIELEATFALSENLSMNVGYAYADAELTDDLTQPQKLANPAKSLADATIAEDGDRLPGVAKHVASLSLSHSASFSGGAELVSRLSGYYQSNSINHISPTSSAQDEFSGFSIWNASATLYMDQWTASLHVKNIFDEEGVTGSYPDAYRGTDTGTFENYYGSNQKEYIGSPRTLTFGIGYSF